MRRVTRVAIALVSAVACAAAADERVIQYADDALTVRLAKTPLSEVLDEVARQSGAEVHGALRAPREVTAEFEDVPLPEALHRLLGEQNFALIYGDGGRLKTVRLLGGPLAPPPPSAAPPTASSVPSPPASLPALVGLFEAHAPVPVQGRLSQALGTDTATFSQLGDMALHHDDVLVRTEAVRVGLQVIEAEPEFRSAVISGVTGMGNGDLSTFVRGLAGPRADELVLRVITLARATELRAKASAVLQDMRAQPGAAPPPVAPPQPGG